MSSQVYGENQTFSIVINFLLFCLPLIASKVFNYHRAVFNCRRVETRNINNWKLSMMEAADVAFFIEN